MPTACAASFWFALGLSASCKFDKGDRWVPLVDAGTSTTGCIPETRSCLGNQLHECAGDRTARLVDDCAERGLVCSTDLKRCSLCQPGSRSCDGQQTRTCVADGSGYELGNVCDEAAGSICRGGRCQRPCDEAAVRLSNVGCEYWAADLDNAVVDATLNAAKQQYAVVVSNPQTDAFAYVTVERDDSAIDEPNSPVVVLTARIAPLGLEVYPLGPREVDGSAPGEFNTGTHSAHTRSAYRITSSVPVVAYQFNPLDNVGVFSNDASLLKPQEALTDGRDENTPSYVVLGWPQTLASTDDPATNFDPGSDSQMRAFITIVGTGSNTLVRVQPTARIIGAPGIPETSPGEVLEATLSAFDTLNLETDDFNADFTGSLISSSRPVAVFSGTEASDAPRFEKLGDRSCCADHLEEQLDPIRTAGRRFIAPVSSNRTAALAAAGATLGVVESAEVFRVVAATENGANITTTVPGRLAFRLEHQGDFAELLSTRDFMLESDQPVMLASISPSQQAAGVPTGLPGGDPSFLVIPPIEQYREDYTFLTPAAYAFDFLRIIAPRDAEIVLDGEDVRAVPGCSIKNPPGLLITLPDDVLEETVVYRCQLSFPVFDRTSGSQETLLDGVQNDGVHRLEANQRVGVLVDGFDRNVSYSYAAGTELEQIVAR